MLWYNGEGRQKTVEEDLKMEKGICVFFAIVTGIAGLMSGGIFGAIVGAIGGYCLGAKITS